MPTVRAFLVPTAVDGAGVLTACLTNLSRRKAGMYVANPCAVLLWKMRCLVKFASPTRLECSSPSLMCIMPYLRRAHNCNSDGVHLDTAATRAGTRLFPDSSTKVVLPLLYLMSSLALLALHVFTAIAHHTRGNASGKVLGRHFERCCVNCNQILYVIMHYVYHNIQPNEVQAMV